MVKLLVNTPAGAQEVIEVTATGSYFDDDRVLWDERRDGPLPEITLGGMVRVGDSLVFDESAARSRVVEKQAPRKVITAESIFSALVKKGVLKEGDV